MDANLPFTRRHGLPRECRLKCFIPLLARKRLGLPTAEAATVHRLTPGESDIESPLQPDNAPGISIEGSALVYPSLSI